MNNDRKTLIRLAASRPVGDPVRKVLLAELQKQGQRGKPGHEILEGWVYDESGIGDKWLTEPYEGNSSSKVPNLSKDNPIGPKEKWDTTYWGFGGVNGKWNPLKIEAFDGFGEHTNHSKEEGEYTTMLIVVGDFTRRFDGDRSPAKIWSGKGKVFVGDADEVFADSEVNFSFTDGKVDAIKRAFDKALRLAQAQAKKSVERLRKPQVWSAVVSYQGEASHIQTFKTEADAKASLKTMRGKVSYDVVEGEQLWNKSVGTVK